MPRLGIWLMLLAAPACSGNSSGDIARRAALTACGLNDGTVEDSADVRACAADDEKKTTLCHVPRGNPANAHTLCVGNAAVAAHLRNHGGDHVGPCHSERKCAPPDSGDSSTGTAGAPGAGGAAGSAGAGDTGGAGGSDLE
jgi:hypothetical protein